MDNRHKWFFAALAFGVGAYWLTDANESVKSTLAVLAFLVFSLIGEREIDKEALRETNKLLWDEIRRLEGKIDALELELELDRDS